MYLCLWVWRLLTAPCFIVLLQSLFHLPVFRRLVLNYHLSEQLLERCKSHSVSNQPYDYCVLPFVSIFFLISEYTNRRVFWCTGQLKFDSEPPLTGQEERCLHAGAALSVCPHGGFHPQVCGSLSCSGVTARGLQDQRDSTGTTLFVTEER